MTRLVIMLVGLFLSLGYYMYNEMTDIFVGTGSSKSELRQEHKIYSNNATMQQLDGTVLFEKNSDETIKPASLTKMMTAIIAIETLPDVTQVVPINGNGITDLYYEGASVAGFAPNAMVTVEELLYGLMLPSGADAAVTLSHVISGSDAAFAEEMNKKAGELGMTKTHFTNSYGTESADQYSTVNDLALLLRYSLQNDTFRDVFTTEKYVGSNYSFESTLFKKLGNTSVKKGDIIGGKTGYTEEAGLCLASLAEVEGEEYIVITVGAKGDHKTKQFNMLDAKSLYNQL